MIGTEGEWRKEADAVLANVDASLPADADLVTRRQACLRAKPWKFADTSWGKKVWAIAQRAYLERHGLPKRQLPEPPLPLLSPLERAKQKSEEIIAKRQQFSERRQS